MKHPGSDLALVEAVVPLLRTCCFGRALRGYETVGSTNTVAAAWAAEGAPEGAVVVAEYQTAGRGRRGRAWEASAGRNLTFSVVLRPTLAPERLGLITLAASVAVAEAVSAFTAPLEATIKWPNDVLLEGKKCCGMLLESSLYAHHGGAAAVILGIGLNVNQDTFPPSLAERATSLLLAAGRLVPRPPLLACLLERLEARYETLTTDGGAAVRKAYEARLAGLHRPVTFYLDDGTRLRGILAGLTDTGAVCIETAGGPRVFHAGEVSTAPPA
ncbi:biotin--[acetyl-CoA-carboxylase] ligase [Rhodocaloribacter litoris]|uniref:biotin--[acetyl-CoA-carboxylase] ligase n=1 Tax=Rhodocaloribacter litoris TaxID=2558931 RepID=UPI001421E822|nr:biotin--[acetyl-CoA-carboxylase] ligase [Rhodocaloribacter litoris]QXD14302.1 biotin--[acetyl-CoA-carboxylase] ligase [Rhodocaloribacter litoris]